MMNQLQISASPSPARPDEAVIAACLQKVGAREADVLAAQELKWYHKGLNSTDAKAVAYFIASSTKLLRIK